MFTILLTSLSNNSESIPLSDLRNFEEQTELILSILTKFFIVSLVLIAIVYVIRVLSNKNYSIRNINVPASFEQFGHSGPVIANRMYYRLQQIIQQVSANYHLKGYSAATAEKEVSVDLVGMGLPIKGFVELIGGAIGINRGKKVDADFYQENNVLVMILKITGHPAEKFDVPINDSIDMAIKTLISEAAETILKYSNDEILQTYFGLIEQIGEKQIKLARYRYEHCRTNKNTEVNIIAAWAWGLCMFKKYDEAEEKIKEGIAQHKKAGRIYVIWGSLLMQKNRPKEALEKFNLALAQVNKNESITRISNIYSSIGNCYVKLGQIDIAMKYMQKAIKIDPNSSRSFFNLSQLHLANKDEDQVFEILEKALEKGLQKQNLINNSQFADLMQHPKMIRLLEKYFGR